MVDHDDGAELPSNWGRWGPDDEAGTLNLVTDAVRARAVREARTGRSVSLAMPVDPTSLLGGPFPPQGPPSPPWQQALLYTGAPPRAMAESWVLGPHHRGLTHLDAVVHIPVDGHVYPGRPLGEAATAFGVRHGSTSAFADGVLTRGVLLDLAPGGRLPAGDPVTGDDLDAAQERGGVEIEAGDALVVRGGWSPAHDLGSPIPGMTVDAVAWMHRRDVAVYAGDVGDAIPSFGGPVGDPLHEVGLARLGMPLIDVASVDELAATCDELDRRAFLLVLAPPRFRAATGVPVNPLAVF